MRHGNIVDDRGNSDAEEVRTIYACHIGHEYGSADVPAEKQRRAGRLRIRPKRFGNIVDDRRIASW